MSVEPSLARRGRRIVRIPEVVRRSGMSRSWLYANVLGQHLRLLPLGPKCRGVFEDELDVVLNGIADGSIVITPKRRWGWQQPQRRPPSPSKRPRGRPRK
jgi:hypothetical protein